MWSIATTKFTGDKKRNVKQLHAVRVGPPPAFKPVEGSEFTIDCDLVLLALGFTGPEPSGMLEKLGVELEERGNIKTTDFQSSIPGVFAAGDSRRGQSLVVHAINEGRLAAEAIHKYLTDEVHLG